MFEFVRGALSVLFRHRSGSGLVWLSLHKRTLPLLNKVRMCCIMEGQRYVFLTRCQARRDQSHWKPVLVDGAFYENTSQ